MCKNDAGRKHLQTGPKWAAPHENSRIFRDFAIDFTQLSPIKPAFRSFINELWNGTGIALTKVIRG
jgi:hypothetical protein